MLLNRARGMIWISSEQAAVSALTGIGFQSVADWNPWIALVLAVMLTAAYYTNLIHVRFFGTIVERAQIRQFLFSPQTNAVTRAMLLQALPRLVKRSDIYFVLLLAEVSATVFIVAPPEAGIVWMWLLTDIVLLSLFMMTYRQLSKLRTGTIAVHRFGMFFSYYFSWLLERKRRSEQEMLFGNTPLLPEQEVPAEATAEDRIDDDEWFGKFKGMNVILIQLESFQQFLLHHRVEGQEVTPFLNRLAGDNLAFTDVFSQFAMGHTSDAELAVLQSLFPSKNEVVNYSHYDKTYYGLPAILRDNGYHAMAYHGYKGDFYNRRAMMRTHGFEAFHAEEDYDSHDRASFWMSDFSFFEQSVEKIKAMKTPFFAFMISLTSHFPFQLEKERWGLQLSKEIPDMLAMYYQSVNYADRALQHFYERLDQEGLLDNTVIACYGDHEGVPVDHLPELYEVLGISQSTILRDPNRMSVAKVPFVVASGDSDRRIRHSDDRVGSTMDVGQTLLHLLGLPRIPYGMGMSLLQAPADRAIPLSQYPLGSFATKDTLCCASASGEYAESTLFDRHNRKMLLPLSGDNKRHFDDSAKQLLRSDYLISNDLLHTAPKGREAAAPFFSPTIEKLLHIVEDGGIVIPISYGMEAEFLKGQGNDLESLLKLGRFYSRSRNKNINFYAAIDWNAGEAPIYFDDPNYIQLLSAKGYDVEQINAVPLPSYLDRLPDHTLLAVAVKDEGASRFVPEFAEAMTGFGFHNMDHTKIRHSYVNVVYKNRGFLSLFEEVSPNPIELEWSERSWVSGLELPVQLQIVSKGAFVGNKAEIKINGKSYCSNARGLNFAVIDMDTGHVIDAFHADTFSTTLVSSGMYRAVKASLLREEIS